MIVKDTPTFMKSLKLYCPGPTTRVFTGEEIGVINAADEAGATIIANGYGDAPRSLAMASVTGAISTAVAVLEMTKPSAEVITNKVASTRRGAAPPTKLTAASAKIDPSSPL